MLGPCAVCRVPWADTRVPCAGVRGPWSAVRGSGAVVGRAGLGFGVRGSGFGVRARGPWPMVDGRGREGVECRRPIQAGNGHAPRFAGRGPGRWSRGGFSPISDK
jgi:hypothetical protein